MPAPWVHHIFRVATRHVCICLLSHPQETVSVPAIIDLTPPDISQARVSHGGNRSLTNGVGVSISQGDLQCVWDGIVDSGSGIHHYEVCFGTQQQACDFNVVPVVVPADKNTASIATFPWEIRERILASGKLHCRV